MTLNPSAAVIKFQDSRRHSTEELHNLAFELNHSHVFHIWLSLSRTRQDEELLNKYIFKSICHEIGGHTTRLIQVDVEAAMQFGTEFRDRVFYLAERLRAAKLSFSQQWFEALDILSRGFLETHILDHAQAVIELAGETGSNKFPGIAQSIAITQAHLSLMLGKLDAAEEIALRFVRKPFLMPSRAQRPLMYMRVLPILAKTGYIEEYREVVWRGLTGFYKNASLRSEFAVKARTTYRGSLRTLFRSDVPIAGRHIFALQMLTGWAGGSALMKWAGIHRAFDSLLWAQLYIRNYLTNRRPYLSRPTGERKRIGWPFRKKNAGKILVTRAMGGMGDLLMMVPGLIALKKKLPNKTVHFAIQKGFFPLFDGMTEFECLDINSDDVDIRDYDLWYDLTDCPAARVEDMQYPRVRSNRIAIFAGAMGVKLRRLKRSGILPRYLISDAERNVAREILRGINSKGLPIIGVQPFSADTYKNWPHMNQLVLELSLEAIVLVFHSEPFLGYEGENVHKIIKPLRQSFALAAECSLLIAPDSSFVHLGAAINVPTVAIFGPTAGNVFTKYYHHTVKLVSPAKSEFGCSPCWRNENMQCAITGDRESVCLRHISLEQVRDAIHRPPPTTWERFKTAVENYFW